MVILVLRTWELSNVGTSRYISINIWLLACLTLLFHFRAVTGDLASYLATVYSRMKNMLLLLWVEGVVGRGVVGRGTCGSRVVGDGSRGSRGL